MVGGAEVSTAFLVLCIVLFIFIFNEQICLIIDNLKGAFVGLLGGSEHASGQMARVVDSSFRGMTEHANGKSPKFMSPEQSVASMTENWQPTKSAPGYRNREHLEDGDPSGLGLPPGQVSDVLTVLGYTGQQPWGEIVKATELDPSVFVNHNEFVKDVRRFSSGANFTSVNDDNTNIDFVNFIGLRRPTHVPIGETARSQPDIDQSVLKRNQRFSWNDGPNFSIPLSERNQSAN